AFEFTTEALGAQSAVLAGGRYDGLVEQMGGASTPGVGWASGIERLSMLIDDIPPRRRPFAIVPLGNAAEEFCLKLTNRLRRAGLIVDLSYRGKMKQRMKRANHLNARAAIIIGDDELEQSSATVRDLDSGEQELVSLNDLQHRLENFL
ncbi:MAG: His/Gly/Thr/Pro-type tRNA ligase C-terminal domain-containing protein, partial [Pseudomonadota bacterium]|nr:His/Gly/Thr/Pro-type tRNA ligase C-terminal domain-containing protein [Pseudomonadota bacterium]